MIRFDRSALRDTEAREAILDLLEAGFTAVDPERLVFEELKDHSGDAGIRVIAIGKAAVPMARGAARALGARLARGIVLAPYEHGGGTPNVIECYEAGHPIPDESGVRAAEAIREFCAPLGHADRLLCLLSGGGSALLAAPVPGVELKDLAQTTRLLLACGATIGEINTVRRHLSTLQGGGLARAAYPASLLTLILSDVVEDRIETIASGPTMPDPTTFADAERVLRRHRLRIEVPLSVRRYLRDGADGRVPETAKPGDPIFERADIRVVANNSTFLDAVCEHAARIGLRVHRELRPMVGEARNVGACLGQHVAELAESIAEPTLLVAGGETTVTLHGDGRGGRNQEVALAAAQALEGTDSVLFATCATDGTDGVTDAAGALVDGATIDRGRESGLDPELALRGNDSYVFLSATGDLLRTGPTGTNVADVVLALIRPRRSSASTRRNGTAKQRPLL